MYDSVLAPYPTDENCFPGGGEDTPTGRQGLGECDDGEPPGVVFTWGRFFAACPSCNDQWGGGFSPTDCRPFVCTTDDDCPNFAVLDDNDEVVMRTYECRNALCQSADTESYPVDFVDHMDAMLLCYANVERVDYYEGEPYCPGVEWNEFDKACPLPLPEACMQP